MDWQAKKIALEQERDRAVAAINQILGALHTVNEAIAAEAVEPGKRKHRRTRGRLEPERPVLPDGARLENGADRSGGEG